MTSRLLLQLRQRPHSPPTTPVAGPLAVKAGVWTLVEELHRRGYGLMYSGRVGGWRGVAYLLACVVALDYLHDTWFYWTHRLLHTRPLYARVHALHHRSTVPTAFTGYSFHVAEAALVFANEVLVCFLLPLHMGLHRVYHLATTVIHEGEWRVRAGGGGRAGRGGLARRARAGRLASCGLLCVAAAPCVRAPTPQAATPATRLRPSSPA